MPASRKTQGIRLAVRLGIHTGLVVVGDIGAVGRQEQLALGETPNIAARLQGLAAPDTVVISGATAQLVHGYFVCQPLGAQSLKGLAQPLMYTGSCTRVGRQTRLDVAATRGLTPLVGREQEVGLLAERWERATRGDGAGRRAEWRSRHWQIPPRPGSEGPDSRRSGDTHRVPLFPAYPA